MGAAGTQLLVVQPGDKLEELKEEVMADMADIFSSVDKGGALLMRPPHPILSPPPLPLPLLPAHPHPPSLPLSPTHIRPRVPHTCA